MELYRAGYVSSLVTLGAALRDRGVQLRVPEQGIDTATAEGRAMFGMLSVLAELRRELIVANTRDGLAAARPRDRTGGRRPKLSPSQARHAQELYDGRQSALLLASFRSWRDRAIVGLMLLSGLRSCEVLSLQVAGVNIARRWTAWSARRLFRPTPYLTPQAAVDEKGRSR